MAFEEYLRAVDDYISHTDIVVSQLQDPFIESRYVGFITVSAVTAYELALKEILIKFAKKKHKVFGNVIEGSYQRINGRVRLDDIKSRHIKQFGEKYLEKFNKKLEKQEAESLRNNNGSIKASYGNIVTWRDAFVHKGNVPTTVSYREAVGAFERSKDLIYIIAESMVR